MNLGSSLVAIAIANVLSVGPGRTAAALPLRLEVLSPHVEKYGPIERQTDSGLRPCPASRARLCSGGGIAWISGITNGIPEPQPTDKYHRVEAGS